MIGSGISAASGEMGGLQKIIAQNIKSTFALMGESGASNSMGSNVMGAGWPTIKLPQASGVGQGLDIQA
jgi:hypothetical protein